MPRLRVPGRSYIARGFTYYLRRVELPGVGEDLDETSGKASEKAAWGVFGSAWLRRTPAQDGRLVAKFSCYRFSCYYELYARFTSGAPRKRRCVSLRNQLLWEIAADRALFDVLRRRPLLHATLPIIAAGEIERLGRG
jgi:hypothetical protein